MSAEHSVLWASIKSVVNGLYDAAALFDHELKLIEYNAAYQAMTGLRPRRLERQRDQGILISDLLIERTGAAREAALSCIADQKPVHLVEQRLANKEGDSWITWISYLPILAADGHVVAGLQLIRDVTGDAHAQEKLKELLALTRQRAHQLEVAVEDRTKELRAALEEVTRLSRVDPLTGLLNRRAFTEHANQALDIARRYGRNLAILELDLDHFKKINDQFGHQAGDAVLIAVARALEEKIRESDRVARFGGEEFVILLSETSPASIEAVSQRFNECIRGLASHEIVEGMSRRITTSIGVAMFPEHGDVLEDLLRKADAALYHAKQSGRDCTMIYSDATSSKDLSTKHHERVLLVSSDRRWIGEAQKLLGTRFDVVTATTAQFALTLSSHSRYDVIVTEQSLADLDGIEFLGYALKSNPGALRVLLLEGENFGLAVRATNHAQVDHFLMRNESPDLLVGIIERGLSKKERLLENLLSGGLYARNFIAGARILESVLARSEFEYAFQPVIQRDGTVFGFEALARPETGGRIGPAELFETAVRTGDIWRLSRHARRGIASQIHSLKKEHFLFVNLHPAEIDDPELSGPQNPLHPYASSIIFEITERADIVDFDQFRKRMKYLRSLGYRFAVDDLGAGYASLSSIAQLEPDFIKIDMSITRELHLDERRRSLIRRIVNFADDHGIYVVAEGVEEQAEAICTHEIGCHLFQGYFFAKPSREGLRTELPRIEEFGQVPVRPVGLGSGLGSGGPKSETILSKMSKSVE